MIAILHNIRSIHNTASMFRTGDGAGVEKIYLTGITPAPVDKLGKAIGQFTKVSLGAEDFVSWEKIKDISRVIKSLKKDGYKIFAVEQSPKSIPYYSLKVKNYPALAGPRHGGGKFDRVALIMGNEVKGLSPATLKQCDKILEIPMRGAVVRQAYHPRQIGRGKESLNVSVAFGIVAYALAGSSLE